MNKIKIFYYEHREIRTIEVDGEIWWILKDVCDVLGLRNARVVADRLDDDEVRKLDLRSRQGKINIINESGLYNVILRSDKPEAKKFRRWVTHEVLPSIRKYGVYATEELLEHKAMLDTAMEMLAEVRDQKDKMCEIAQELFDVVDEYKPKVDYYDEILRCDCAMTTTQIASDYGLSAVVLNKILEREGVQRRINGQWVLYKKHMGKGYTSSETSPCKKGKRYRVRTKWTQTGRLLIHEILMRLVDEADMELFED